MKKYLTLATAALLMAACSEKPGYTISGTVANADLNGKYVYLYEYGAKDAAPLDSALIANGQFSLTGSQDSPRLCELKVNTGDAGEQGYQTVFVLENGQLQARMDAKSSAVSGTAENDAFVSLNTSLETLFQGFDKLNEESRSKDTAIAKAAAQKIGMNGQTKVQVQVMANESMAVKNATIGATTPAQQPVAQQPAPVVETTVVTTTQAPGTTVTTTAPAATSGEYSVQVAAFYAQDSADSLASRMMKYGNAVVVQEGDMYKVRIVNLDATQARSVIDALRSNEGMAPGLLRNGRWINADSI